MSFFQFFWILFLILANGFFVAAEFAIVKVRASQIEIKSRGGHPLAKLAKTVHTHMDAYLSATQLGITITSLAVGWFGESAVATGLMSFFETMGFHLSPVIAHQVSFFLAFFAITILHIVVGELVPKTLAIQYPLSVTMGVVAPLRAFYFLFSPLIRILNTLANWCIRLLGLKPMAHHEGHSIEELRLLVEQGESSGLIKTTESDIIKNVFYSSDKIVKQIMTSRTQIEALSISATLDEVMTKFVTEGYSRLPVFQNDLDHIVGILYAKDVIKVLHQLHEKPLVQFNWKDKMIKPHFVPESKKIIILLRELQAKRSHMVIVVDEFGSTAGVVTIEDVIEELVGEIQDEYDAEMPVIEKVGRHEWRAQGLAPVNVLNQHLPTPLPISGDYETLSGLLNLVLRRIPVQGDKIRKFGYEFQVLKTSKRRAEIVQLTQNL